MTDPTTPAPRPHEERLADTRARFERDVDVWVSTADAAGTPCLVPLSYLWDGETFLISTARTNPTARNLTANGRARLAFGTTRDVVLAEGAATLLEAADLTPATREAFATHTGFDPSALRTPYPYFRITPTWIQAWREVDELPTRQLMSQGRWLP